MTVVGLRGVGRWAAVVAAAAANGGWGRGERRRRRRRCSVVCVGGEVSGGEVSGGGVCVGGWLGRNLLLKTLGLDYCLEKETRTDDLAAQQALVGPWLDKALERLRRRRPGELRDADLDGGDETGLKNLLLRALAPLAEREAGVHRLLEHPWLRHAPDVDLGEATLPLFIRPAPPLPGPPADAGSGADGAGPGAAAPGRVEAVADEGLFRADLELVEAEVEGVGACWVVLGVGPTARAEWPWLRPFDPCGAGDGCVVTRIDGCGPDGHRDKRQRPTLRRAGPFGSEVELTVRYCPGRMAEWAAAPMAVTEVERVIVTRRTRLVHQEGAVWDPQRYPI